MMLFVCLSTLLPKKKKKKKKKIIKTKRNTREREVKS